jgi:hypothetical protein
MTEPWKKIVCSSPECMKTTFSAAGKVEEKSYIYPDIDNEVMTQFTCPRCGRTETWGLTRRNVSKILYERYNKCPES